MPPLLTTSNAPFFLTEAWAGRELYYTRNTDRTTRGGPVFEIHDLDRADRGEPFWPKPRCCRFVYVLRTPGFRTLCECRLRRRP